MLPAQTARRPKQVVADPSRPFPVESINVTGNQQFSDTEIVRMSGLTAGQLVRKSDFDAAQKRLLDSGLFETVAYRYMPVPGSQSVAATFEVKEIGQLFPYRFEAIDVPDATLRAWLHKDEPLFRDRIPATPPVLKRFTDSLDQYLAAQNKPLKITGKLLPNPKGDLEVVFLPSSLPAVAQVRFIGNRVLSAPALQSGVSGAAIGALYTETRFRQILDASVRPLYEERGYLHVAFPKIETQAAADVRGIVATVHVVEGEPYKLHDVKITGEMAENQRMLKEGSFRTGEVVDMKAVHEGAKRIERAMKRRGYLSASTTIDRKLDDKTKQVDVAINLDPGPQYKMGKLEIIGLDITTEPQIRKMWSVREKAPFDAEYPDIFLSEMPNVLDNLGKTRSTIKPDPGTLTVDVILTFNAPEDRPEDKQKPAQDNRPNEAPVTFP